MSGILVAVFIGGSETQGEGAGVSKPRDAVKERFWRGLLRQWEGSEQGTGEFCRQAGVPEYQLHWWRRTLERRDQADEHVRSSSVSRRERAVSSGEGSRQRSDRNDNSPFVRVLLPSAATPLEVVHPGGCLIRVPGDCDTGLLASVLAVLDAGSRAAEGAR